MGFKKSWFYIDGLGEDVIEGYTEEGSDWNGWATPHFTKENSLKVLSLVSSIGGAELAKYREKTDEMVVTAEVFDLDATEHFEGTDITVDGETLRVYPVGAFSWTWEELDNYKVFDKDPYYKVDDEDSLIILSYCSDDAELYACVEFVIYNSNSFKWSLQVRKDLFNNHDELLELLKKDEYSGEGSSVTI